MHLSRRLAFAAWAFVFTSIATMGLPGFSGFVAELQVLVAAWQANPWWAMASGVGIIVGVAYIWRALQKAFFSDALPSPHELESEQAHKFAPITWPEYAGVALLVVSLIASIVDLYPPSTGRSMPVPSIASMIIDIPEIFALKSAPTVEIAIPRSSAIFLFREDSSLLITISYRIQISERQKSEPAHPKV